MTATVGSRIRENAHTNVHTVDFGELGAGVFLTGATICGGYMVLVSVVIGGFMGAVLLVMYGMMTVWMGAAALQSFKSAFSTV